MTSKEALESWFSVISTQDKIRWEEHYKVIKKDLEILEIIKKYLVRTFDYPEGSDYFCLELHKFVYEKEGMKFKEWLENE